MCEPMRRPAPSLTLLEKEHAYTREYEDADAGVHRERVVDHEQRATKYWRDHPASVHAMSIAIRATVLKGSNTHILERAEAMPQAVPRTM